MKRAILFACAAIAATAGSADAQRVVFESPRLAQAPLTTPSDVSEKEAPSDLAPRFSTGVEALDNPATFLPKRAQELSVDIRPSPGVIPEAPPGDYIGGAQSRAELYRGEEHAVAWQASGMSRTPIYFDDPRVERHGMVSHRLIQPAASVVRFYGTFPLLPALMILEPPCNVRYCLGEGRWSLGVSERFATPY